MKFLENIKNEFKIVPMSIYEVKPLKIQLVKFIDSELKPYYADMIKRKLNKITFFKLHPVDGTSYINGLEKEKFFNEEIERVCNLIDEIIYNLDEYQIDNQPQVIGDYVLGDKVSGDKAGRDINKAGGDIVFGNKVSEDETLNDLKNKLNEQIDNVQLKKDLIKIIDEINKNKENKEKKNELVNKLWERGSQFMTILGPFAPYLFNL